MILLQVVTAKLLTRGKASLRNYKTLTSNVTSFVWILSHCLFLLSTATGAVPIPIPLVVSPHQVCRFSFVACRDVHRLLFPIFEWMDHLVVDDTCYIIHALFSDCLLVSSWCLVSSRSKGGIAFECSESAVRTVRARQYFTIVAG